MILCDTNIFIEIYRSNSDIINAMKRIGQYQMAVSHVTCAELYFGARNKREMLAIEKDLQKLTILPIQLPISTMAIQFVRQYALSHTLQLPDALIASTAIYHDIELFTLNQKDFRFIQEVRLFDMSSI